eukprot:CAMPEP_0171109110 /NCGR_PEP_ID=MMETSP0766_2-20121228/70303_1 /TAXON_ID=439317 /ORGANISM="Gambierdiscus australes, Strain CAWD 149" /LENGTH=37 /DNA_ID= /DNA_START= /DNA_END= /DNA_ORIENTATION=
MAAMQKRQASEGAAGGKIRTVRTGIVQTQLCASSAPM